jgi:hypothetical protein
MRFLAHTTLSRTPMDEWSARRKGLYLTTHNTQTQTSMLPVGFEPAIPASERPQTHALDRAATGISTPHTLVKIVQNTTISFCVSWHPVSAKLMLNTNVKLSTDAWLWYCNDAISSDRVHGWSALQSRVMRRLFGHHIFANRGHYYTFCLVINHRKGDTSLLHNYENNQQEALYR